MRENNLYFTETPFKSNKKPPVGGLSYRSIGVSCLGITVEQPQAVSGPPFSRAISMLALKGGCKAPQDLLLVLFSLYH